MNIGPHRLHKLKGKAYKNHGNVEATDDRYAAVRTVGSDDVIEDRVLLVDVGRQRHVDHEAADELVQPVAVRSFQQGSHGPDLKIQSNRWEEN